MLSKSSPPSNLYTFHIYLTSFTCDSLHYGDRLHKNLWCLHFLKKKPRFLSKKRTDSSTLGDGVFRKIWHEAVGLAGYLELPLTWTMSMSYFGIYVNLSLYVCMIYASAKSNISKFSLISVLHTCSQMYIWKSRKGKMEFSLISAAEISSICRYASKFAGDCVRDTNNLPQFQMKSKSQTRIRPRQTIHSRQFLFRFIELPSHTHFPKWKVQSYSKAFKSPKNCQTKLSSSICEFAQTLYSIWRHQNKVRINLTYKCN